MQSADQHQQTSSEASSGTQAANMYNHYQQARVPYTAPPTYPQNVAAGTGTENNINNLAHMFGGMGMKNHLQGAAAPYNTSHVFVLPNGQVLPNMAQPTMFAQGQASGVDAAGGMPYLPSAMFPNFVAGANMVPGSLSAYPWPYAIQGDVPDLAGHRRNSWSSNEENGPVTPGLAGTVHPEYYTTIAPMDRSPMVGYYNNTPSPPSMNQSYIPGPMQPMKCQDNKTYELVDLDALTQQYPAIPRAVPALWTNQDDLTLAKCLQNPEGITNIYIRGFLPDTTDKDLEGFAARFGDIESCKAIIDMDTGKCKGFGFVKYYHPSAAENCIRGFFHLGYQASYAQKSRNSRLKDLEDRSSTNIYCTGVPIEWNEANLRDHFLPYRVVSEKISRDEKDGKSKEVGFARFENRDIAEKVLAEFHSVTAADGVKLNLRFADTKAQKQLKAQSNERRNYRKDEYAYSVEHATTPSPTLHRLQQTAQHFTPASQASFPSPAGINPTFTPATSVSPPNAILNKSMGNVRLNSSWPARGGLPFADITTSYRNRFTPPTRNAFSENMPPNGSVKVSRSSAEITNKQKTPSPKKTGVKTESITSNTSRKEFVAATPKSTA